MRACPSCRRTWSDAHEACPDCLAELIPADQLDATITCGQCGHVCPARMQTCPSCFALLRPAEADLTAALTETLVTGVPMDRPVGRTAFASGPECTVRRLKARSPLVLLGAEGFIEATVGLVAEVPLECVDGSALLFRLQAYGAAPDAVVAIGPDGAPLVTVLREGRLEPHLVVRDETSAPVARLVHAAVDYQLVDTAGRLLARGDRVDEETDGWLDDRWHLAPVAGVPLPLGALAVVAVVVAAKVLLGRAEPEEVEPRVRVR